MFLQTLARMRPSVLALALILLSAETQAQICKPVDLIDATSPILSQEYEGDLDSYWCFAFTWANVIGQALGRAVDPADLALQYYFLRGKVPFQTNAIWQKTTEGIYRDRMIAPDASALKLFGLGSNVEVVPQLMASVGYCARQADQSSPSDAKWFSRLKERAHNQTAQAMIDDLNRSCGPRVFLPEHLSVRWFDLQWMHEQRPAQAMANIEAQLHRGKRVVLSLRSSSSSHIVTVQGLTEDCRLIIQNSNSLGEQPAEIYGKYGSPHIQLWTRAKIEELILAYGYLEEASWLAPLMKFWQ